MIQSLFSLPFQQRQKKGTPIDSATPPDVGNVKWWDKGKKILAITKEKPKIFTYINQTKK